MTLSTNTNKAFENLKKNLAELESVLVAFSGGVDSTLLLKVAHDVLGKNCVAATVTGYSLPLAELEQTQKFCQQEGIEQLVIELDELSIQGFRDNPPNRCYYCKHSLFSTLQAHAKNRGLSQVIEGSNLDDTDDWRPGLKAIAELGVKSPLKDAGLTKEQIRELSQELGLPTWDKPSAACLASRIPYYETITKEKLERVEAAERFLHELGFTQLRVRSHNDLARIEVLPEDIERLMQGATRTLVSTHLKELGFTYISCDLLGFRSGAMNEVL